MSLICLHYHEALVFLSDFATGLLKRRSIIYTLIIKVPFCNEIPGAKTLRMIKTGLPSDLQQHAIKYVIKKEQNRSLPPAPFWSKLSVERNVTNLVTYRKVV